MNAENMLFPMSVNEQKLADTLVETTAKVEDMKSELKQLKKIYHAANLMLSHAVLHGEIFARDKVVNDLMEVLYEYDGGTYKPQESAG